MRITLVLRPMRVNLDSVVRDGVVQVERLTSRLDDVGAEEHNITPRIARVLIVEVTKLAREISRGVGGVRFVRGLRWGGAG